MEMPAKHKGEGRNRAEITIHFSSILMGVYTENSIERNVPSFHVFQDGPPVRPRDSQTIVKVEGQEGARENATPCPEVVCLLLVCAGQGGSLNGREYMV